MSGQRISHYQLLEKLGDGGMGVVYKALDLKLDRFVALKFLPRYIGQFEEKKQRFINEAKTASALDHNNICTIHEIDQTEEGQLFIAMTYYEGETLEQKIERGHLTTEAAIDITIQIGRGLAKAHEKGIIHRDIKPANIIITKDNVVKIVDFGLAILAGQTRLTKTGSTLGTIAYMSYEQVQGNEIDHRTDIWSLGVVLYEMMAGQLPFEGDHEHIITYSVLTKAPAPISALNPGVSVELEQIINKCLAKIPNERYQHVEELLDDLKSIPADVRQSKRKKTPIKARFLKRKNAALFGIVTFLAVAIIIATGYYFFSGFNRTIDSIAVLPLENLIGDSEQDYFVDGMTEALITELSQISALRVISRTSIMQYKGVKKPLPEIGRELNVEAIVEGAVFREGDRVRITAQLIDAETDHHLWASNYERDLREVLTLQSELASAIAREIRVTLTPQEEVRLTNAEPIDPEVYELYLQGQFHHRTYTREGIEKAIDYFGQAIARDSTFARAYAALEWAYSSLLDLYQAPPKEKEAIAAKAKAARDKAWQLDDTIAELHAGRGYGYLNRGRNIELAGPHFERAVELEPSNARTRWFYGYYLTAIGRADRGVEQLQKAVALDPLNAFLNMAAYWPFFCAGEYDLAIEQLTRARELNPDMPHVHVALGRIYVQQHRFDETITAYRKAIERLPEDTPYSLFSLAFLGHAYGLAGHTEEAVKILEELQPKAKEFALPVALAILNVGIGDKEAALQWLETGYDWQVGQLFWLKPDPVFDSLRSEPRFQDLLNRINLPEEQVITRDR